VNRLLFLLRDQDPEVRSCFALALALAEPTLKRLRRRRG